MLKLEKWFLMVILGLIPPISGFLAVWFSVFNHLEDIWVFMAACGGGLLGVILDLIFLKKWIAKAWDCNPYLWLVVLVFYSICMLGFFMGVPVFNLLLALPVSFYVGRRLAHHASTGTEATKQTSIAILTSTGILALVCTASAVIALNDPTTAANLEGMLRLPFHMTQTIIVLLILLGGSGMLAVNFYLTGFLTRYFARKPVTL